VNKSDQPKISIPNSLTSGAYITQEKVMEVGNKNSSLYIGIPKEYAFQENRISLVPSSVKALIDQGHRIVIETEAGSSSNFSDHEYSNVGAEIVYSHEEVFKADILLKVAPPTLKEIELLSEGQVLFSPLHWPTLSEELVKKLRKKRVTAIAWEYIKDMSGAFPIVRILSQIAGTAAILTASELLSQGGESKGTLLGGIVGVPSSKVVILGAGTVGEFACKTALGLGADVRVFDNNLYKLMRLERNIGHKLNTSIINPVYLKEELSTADVVIGAIHGETGRAPLIVTEDMVSKMQKGSVILDISIDQGGVFATSRLTSHKNPVFKVYDVIHYCVPNISSKVPQTASKAISNSLLPMLLDISKFGGIESLISCSDGLRHGVYTYKGSLTNHHIGDRFGLSSTDINLLLPCIG